MLFEPWCQRTLSRVPWTAQRSKQPILKEIHPGCSLEGLMLKLKLQSFGHLMLIHLKDPDAGRDWGQEEKRMTEDEMVGWHHQLNGYEFGCTPGSWWWTGMPGMLQFMGSQRVRHDWVTELKWTEHWEKDKSVYQFILLKLQQQSFQWIFRTDFL